MITDPFIRELVELLVAEWERMKAENPERFDPAYLRQNDLQLFFEPYEGLMKYGREQTTDTG